MPFESSLPLLLAGLGLALASLYGWLQTQARLWLVAAFLAACGGLGAFIADRMVETDREYLSALFPRLADAAAKQDLAPIFAALDPELHSLRAEVERMIKQVKPTEVRITKLDVTVDSRTSPPTALADLIFRVSGESLAAGSPGDAVAGMRVSLVKRGSAWFVTEAEAKPLGAGP